MKASCDESNRQQYGEQPTMQVRSRLSTNQTWETCCSHVINSNQQCSPADPPQSNLYFSLSVSLSMLKNCKLEFQRERPTLLHWTNAKRLVWQKFSKQVSLKPFPSDVIESVWVAQHFLDLWYSFSRTHNWWITIPHSFKSKFFDILRPWPGVEVEVDGEISLRAHAHPRLLPRRAKDNNKIRGNRFPIISWAWSQLDHCQPNWFEITQTTQWKWIGNH